MSADDMLARIQALVDNDDRRAHNWRTYLDGLPPERQQLLATLPPYGEDVCGAWPTPAAIATSDQVAPGADFSPCLSQPGHDLPYHRGVRFRDFDRPQTFTWRNE